MTIGTVSAALQLATGAALGLFVGGFARLLLELAAGAGARLPEGLTDFQVIGIVFILMLLAFVGLLFYLFRGAIPDFRDDLMALAYAPEKPPPRRAFRISNLRPLVPLFAAAGVVAVITAIAAGGLVGALLAIASSVIARIVLVLWGYAEYG